MTYNYSNIQTFVYHVIITFVFNFKYFYQNTENLRIYQKGKIIEGLIVE